MNSISFSSPTSNRVDAYDVRVLQSDSVCLVMAYYVQILGVTRLRCTRSTGVLGTRGDIYGRCGYFDMGCIEGWLSAIRPLLIVWGWPSSTLSAPPLSGGISEGSSFLESGYHCLEVLDSCLFDSVPTLSSALLPFLFPISLLHSVHHIY